MPKNCVVPEDFGFHSELAELPEKERQVPPEGLRVSQRLLVKHALRFPKAVIRVEAGMGSDVIAMACAAGYERKHVVFVAPAVLHFHVREWMQRIFAVVPEKLTPRSHVLRQTGWYLVSPQSAPRISWGNVDLVVLHQDCARTWSVWTATRLVPRRYSIVHGGTPTTRGTWLPKALWLPDLSPKLP